MDVFYDINEYYPAASIKTKMLKPGFAIIAINDIDKALTPEYFSKYSEPHLRDFFEISISLKEPEPVFLNIGGTNLSPQDRDLLFISPLQTFSLDLRKKINDDITSEGYLIAFKADFLEGQKHIYEIIDVFRFFNSHTKLQFLLEPSVFQGVLDIADKMFTEYTANKPFNDQLLAGYLQVLLYTFNRSLNIGDLQGETHPSNYLSMDFERAIIKDGHRIETVSDYAKRLNVSVNYLSECIKNATGQNARQIILKHKLIVAKNLLQKREKRISEIAYEMGFSVPTNFTKFFKNMTGMAPRHFRSTSIKR